MSKLNFLLIFIASVIIGWQLFLPGYFPMHDDLQVMRLYQMDRCLHDGQIPCRLSPDMGYGYGQPMFNFYSVFPYYLGMIPRLLGFQFIDVVKLLFYVSLLVSGIFMYLFANNFFGPFGALVASVSYMVAPYHSLDIFVRGAMSESWGLAMLPVLLYYLYHLSRQPSYPNLLKLSITILFFLTSHHLTTIIQLPLIAIFTLYFFFVSPHKIKYSQYLIAAVISGLGLSAFFIFPVIFERNLIQQQSLTSDYYTFSAHFATVKQLFVSNHWGYGPSKFGPDDDISFSFGYIQTLGLIISPLLLLAYSKKNRRLWYLILISLLLTVFSLFMTHNKSTPVWLALPFLAIIQFPWRYLGMAIFTGSLLVAAIINIIKKGQIIATITIVLLLLLNFSHNKFEKYFYWINDQQKLSGELFQLQIRAALLDYLPKSVKVLPLEPAPSIPITTGDVRTHYFDYRSNYFASEFDILDESTLITFPVVYFPGWQLYLDRQPSPIEIDSTDDLGRIIVKLNKGHHLVQAWFVNTPVRTIGNLTTVGFAGLLFGWYLKYHEKTT